MSCSFQQFSALQGWLVGCFGFSGPLRQYFSLYRAVSQNEEGWLVGCFRFNGPLRQYFSLYRAVSQREGEREEKRIDESKNVQTTPTRTYYKRSRPLPYCNPSCRTPRHWKFTQHHRTTPMRGRSWLVGCFGFSGLLRQYFSLYRAVSHREGERGERG